MSVSIICVDYDFTKIKQILIATDISLFCDKHSKLIWYTQVVSI